MPIGPYDPPFAADGRSMLIAWLDCERQSILHKVHGLTEGHARWKPAPAANSLIGIVYHLGRVEHGWFQAGFAGDPRTTDPECAESGDEDWGFHPPPSVTLADAIAFYRTQWERSNEIARAATSLDDGGHTRHGDISLRWILCHMIEETARHAGHADIARGFIDGSTGML